MPPCNTLLFRTETHGAAQQCIQASRLLFCHAPPPRSLSNPPIVPLQCWRTNLFLLCLTIAFQGFFQHFTTTISIPKPSLSLKSVSISIATSFIPIWITANSCNISYLSLASIQKSFSCSSKTNSEFFVCWVLWLLKVLLFPSILIGSHVITLKKLIRNENYLGIILLRYNLLIKAIRTISVPKLIEDDHIFQRKMDAQWYSVLWQSINAKALHHLKDIKLATSFGLRPKAIHQ